VSPRPSAHLATPLTCSRPVASKCEASPPGPAAVKFRMARRSLVRAKERSEKCKDDTNRRIRLLYIYCHIMESSICFARKVRIDAVTRFEPLLSRGSCTSGVPSSRTHSRRSPRASCARSLVIVPTVPCSTVRGGSTRRALPLSRWQRDRCTHSSSSRRRHRHIAG
jgi:hypothetical protein